VHLRPLEEGIVAAAGAVDELVQDHEIAGLDLLLEAIDWRRTVAAALPRTPVAV